MIRKIEPSHHITLADYEEVAHLGSAVAELRREAAILAPRLQGRRVWMVNSTEQGGGVAELLPPLLAMLNELGVDARWLVMEPADEGFFRLTKHLHNLIHGEGPCDLAPEDGDLYADVSERTAVALREHIRPGDVVVIHDPQPMGAGAILRGSMDVAAVWRCHIGLDEDSAETDAAWAFLGSYASPYDHAVFTAPEYIPDCFAGRAAVIHPAIDPLSHKNRVLPIHKLVGILANGGLIRAAGPVLTPPFPEPARRLQPDGSWGSLTEEEFGLLFRPIVTQVSRWDRLKGFLPLLEGFIRLKEGVELGDLSERNRRSLRTARLVLAGPDPASVHDDPEGRDVLDEISRTYTGLPPGMRSEIAIVSLPMGSAKFNALLVNALQRCSDIVVQNSLQEGFGLTVTEAMWKGVAVLGTRAAGIRQQIRDGLDGLLVGEPEDPEQIAGALRALLVDQPLRESLGRSAENRVHQNFLLFTQTRRWLELLAEVAPG